MDSTSSVTASGRPARKAKISAKLNIRKTYPSSRRTAGVTKRSTLKKKNGKGASKTTNTIEDTFYYVTKGPNPFDRADCSDSIVREDTVDSKYKLKTQTSNIESMLEQTWCVLSQKAKSKKDIVKQLEDVIRRDEKAGVFPETGQLFRNIIINIDELIEIGIKEKAWEPVLPKICGSC